MKQILAITRCTIKELARSYHYKLLFIFLSLQLQISFVFAALYQSYFTARSPTLGYNSMEFVVGNVDPIHFFLLQFAAVALTLVHFERLQNCDVIESVRAKGYRNFHWIAGTILGISLLVFAIPFVNLLVIYGVSLKGEILRFSFGPPPEPMSLLNLILVDVPTSIVFYVVLALVFHQIRPSKTFVGTATLSVAFVHLVLIQSVPFSWRELVSFSTTNSLLVSEILPYFSTGWILFNRFVWIVLAAGMLVSAALLDRRVDGLRSRYMHVALLFVGLGIAGLTVHGFFLQHDSQTEQRVTAAHRTSSVEGWLDLTNVSGRVEVNPGIRLVVDVELDVKKLSDIPLDSLHFSFNPGLDLQQVRVDGQERKYSFSDGLITIPLISAESDKDSWIVSIRGSGMPDVNFGYPEPKTDYLGSAGHSLQMPKLLGVSNSIFDHRFVVLMPGIRWYPVPLPLGIDKSVQSMQSKVDTYSVDLDIHISNENWKLAAPECTVLPSEDSVHHKIQSSREIPHFAIVASEFQSRTAQAAGVEIELLIHIRHFQSTEYKNAVWNSMLSFIGDRLSDLSEAGLQFPYRSLTFVEVPNHLRFTGGYNMPLLYSQPGVVFIRESGLPIAKWNRIYESYLRNDMSESEIQQSLALLFTLYDNKNILGGNILTSVAEQYFPFINQVDEWKGLALNFVERFLVMDIVSGPISNYSISSDVPFIEELADWTVIYPNLVLDRLFRVYGQTNPAFLFTEKYDRIMTSDASFSVYSGKMSELLHSDDPGLRRSAREYRLATTYAALVALYGNAELKRLLDLEFSRLSKRSHLQDGSPQYGQNDSSSSLIPILREWNDSTQAPAFTISDLDVVRVAVEGAPYTHRASLKLRNDADVTGVVSFANDLYHDSLDTSLIAEIPGQTAYQVNLYATEKIYAVSLNPYYSRNVVRQYLEPSPKSLEDPENVSIEQEYPALTEISWNPHEDSTVIVDNLDSGFSLVDWEGQHKPGLMNKVRWPWEPPQFPSRTVNGIQRFNWDKPRSNQSWRFLEQPWLSYGKYRSSALATYGTDVEIARFSADIPVSGKWSLSYHILSEYTLKGKAGIHNFVLHSAETESHVRVDPKEGSGWIHAGEFDLSNSTIHLDLVSVEPPDSLRVADAIRWNLLSKNEN